MKSPYQKLQHPDYPHFSEPPQIKAGETFDNTAIEEANNKRRLVYIYSKRVISSVRNKERFKIMCQPLPGRGSAKYKVPV